MTSIRESAGRNCARTVETNCILHRTLLGRRNMRSKLYICIFIFFGWLASRLSTKTVTSEDQHMKVLVNYVYHETVHMEATEVRSKRVNLALFIKFAVLSMPKHVTFVFSITGDVPDAQDFQSSVKDVLPTQGKIIFPKLYQVQVLI